ncbi:hypothetical protein [Chryseobacterium sp. JM1]|uniref:hypothetical protein n=1 Tax=Chryseobacterium sp. JM1 TaxID=1233950 RepID=UPI0004E63A71|nr:hypothetical protein [Chryseobacterium sp. JM1]KFF20866.1 hypothetical protein IW22_11150 [Chryseobacterium sp. JM1]
MKIKEAYYFSYYTLYKAWSKNDSPFLSNDFRADICLIALKIWIFITIDAYLSIVLNIKSKLSITDLRGIIPVVVAIGTTLYFFTLSNKWKSYFELFENWPKRKRRTGYTIVWCLVIFIFVNLFFSVELMKSLKR